MYETVGRHSARHGRRKSADCSLLERSSRLVVEVRDRVRDARRTITEANVVHTWHHRDCSDGLARVGKLLKARRSFAAAFAILAGRLRQFTESPKICVLCYRPFQSNNNKMRCLMRDGELLPSAAPAPTQNTAPRLTSYPSSSLPYPLTPPVYRISAHHSLQSSALPLGQLPSLLRVAF